MDATPEPQDDPPLPPGLYLVGTPIGNLEDITLRALRVLRSVDRIACEDTRQTQKLLNHFHIKAPTVSCHLHNERERADQLVAELANGARIALVSDAGMPGISDPGGWLVQAALAAHIPVVPIPGPNAATTALIASGLPTTSFLFLGFPPEKAGPRLSYLETLATTIDPAAPPTILLYEAPHRILETLLDIRAVWGTSVRVVVARELTKLHEEFLRGTAAEVHAQLASRDRVRGEITLLIEPLCTHSDAQPAASLLQRLATLQTGEGLSEKDALKRIARETGQGKSDLYREIQRQRARR